MYLIIAAPGPRYVYVVLLIRRCFRQHSMKGCVIAGSRSSTGWAFCGLYVRSHGYGSCWHFPKLPIARVHVLLSPHLGKLKRRSCPAPWIWRDLARAISPWHSERLLCSSFVIMTGFLIRAYNAYNILPKKELHRSLQVGMESAWLLRLLAESSSGRKKFQWGVGFELLLGIHQNRP